MDQVDGNKIKALCQKHCLKLIILHGSQAKGIATVNSDIDVGILASGKIDYDRFQAIMRDFEGVFGDKFDPVFLNNAEPMISYHVAMAGKPLYESKRGAFADFQIQSIARYQDTKKFRELEKQYVKRAAGKGQLDDR